MFVRSVLAGIIRSLVLMIALLSGALLLGVGPACAQAAEPAAVNVFATPHVLGVPLGTATWALLGVTLLIGGLFAASRSGNRAAPAGGLLHTRQSGVVSESRLAVEPTNDFGRSVSVV